MGSMAICFRVGERRGDLGLSGEGEEGSEEGGSSQADALLEGGVFWLFCVGDFERGAEVWWRIRKQPRAKRGTDLGVESEIEGDWDGGW